MRDNKKREIFVSGYGPKANQQKTIALYAMTEEMRVDREVWNDTIPSPSFLCTYQDLCFTILEEQKSGSVLCYKRVDNQYYLQDELQLQGGELCHIVYQPSNQTLYCSFYETGHVAAVKVEQYHFSEVLNFFQIQGEDASALTRAHCTALEPYGNRVFTVNIALDRIYIYESENGSLTPNPYCKYVQLNKGVGPRHLKFHPIQNCLYVITEYSNEIIVYLYDNEKEAPKFTLLQQVSTLPEQFTGVSYGSSLDISKDGRFLYAANRGADTIAVFDIHADGTLVKIQDISCGGNWPRHIALSKDDSYLYIANQKSSEITFLDVDENSGLLSPTDRRIPFSEASYVEEL